MDGEDDLSYSEGDFEKDEMIESDDGDGDVRGDDSDFSGDFERDVLVDSEEERELVAPSPVEVDYEAFLKSLREDGEAPGGLDWLVDDNDDDYIYGRHEAGVTNDVDEVDDDHDTWDTRADRSVNVSAEEVTDLVKRSEISRRTRRRGKDSLHANERSVQGRVVDSTDSWFELFRYQLDSHVQLLYQGYIAARQRQSDEFRLAATAIRCLICDLQARQARELFLKDMWHAPCMVESNGQLVTVAQRPCFSESTALSLATALFEFVDRATDQGKLPLASEQAGHARALFQGVFSVNLLPRRFDSLEPQTAVPLPSGCQAPSGASAEPWSATEDQVLLAAVRSLGEEGTRSFHNRLFPMRSVDSVNSRLRFLTSRRAPPNPVKDVYLGRQRPFETAEWALLERGVQIFGSNAESWAKIRERYIPNRDATMLEKLWRTRIAKRESRARQRDKARSRTKTT